MSPPTGFNDSANRSVQTANHDGRRTPAQPNSKDSDTASSNLAARGNQHLIQVLRRGSKTPLDKFEGVPSSASSLGAAKDPRPGPTTTPFRQHESRARPATPTSAER